VPARLTATSPARSHAAVTPKLSVVFMIDSQRQRAEWALRAVLEQELDAPFEVLLFDFAAGHEPPIAGSDHPAVRVMPGERGDGYGAALARAAHTARAPVVAFVEEHVVVLPGWARALLRAHEGPYAAVCGEVAPGDLSSANSRRQELVSRNLWSPPARGGESIVLRWQNVSYKRDILLGLGERLPLLLDSEGLLFRELRQAGHRLAIEPAARCLHGHEGSWNGFLVGSFYSNRNATARSIELRGGGVAARLRAMVAAAIGPLRWPFVLLGRTRSLPDRDLWLRELGRNLPWVLEYYAVAGFAGLTAAIFGGGDSSQMFLHYELTEPRRKVEGVEAITG
jgi:hypothetical protein